MGFVNYDAINAMNTDYRNTPAGQLQAAKQYQQRSLGPGRQDPFMSYLSQFGLGNQGPLYNNQYGGNSQTIGGINGTGMNAASLPTQYQGPGVNSFGGGQPGIGQVTANQGGGGVPNINAVTTPSNVFNPRLMQQRANQAAANTVVNHSMLADQAAAPGMSRSGSGLMQRTVAPYAQSLAARPMAYQQSLLGDASMNAQNMLQGNMNRWNETLGYFNPYLDMYQSDSNNWLSGLGALGSFLYNSTGLWG